jgi:branched-chain amino acid transport system ATP-binding protein
MSHALSLSEVTKSFGATQILKGVDLEVVRGERHAIIGPNGAGKSTLFHIISGRFAPTSGTVLLNGRSIEGLKPHQINRCGLSRNFQVTNLFGNLSVYNNLRCGVLSADGRGLSIWRSLSGLRKVQERSEELLRELRLENRRDVPANVLSYAEQRALEIGVAISGGADVILLDEPTAGMSRHETEKAIELIRRVTVGKTLLMVEHDMGVVFELADRISVLVYGEIIGTDTPEKIRGNPKVQEAYLGSDERVAELEGTSR